MGGGRQMAGARFEMCQTRSPHDSAGRRYLWRLLSSNNIEVGRAAATLSDLETCRRRIRRVVDGAGWRVFIEGGLGRWTWRMHHGYTDLAVSSRAYPRRVEAERAFRRFLQLAASPYTTVVTRLPPDRPPGASRADEAAMRGGVDPRSPAGVAPSAAGADDDVAAIGSPAGEHVLAVEFTGEVLGEGVELLGHV